MGEPSASELSLSRRWQVYVGRAAALGLEADLQEFGDLHGPVTLVLAVRSSQMEAGNALLGRVGGHIQ